MAGKRRFLTPGHEELYDWWTWREDIAIDGGKVHLPSKEFVPAIELLSAGKLPHTISVAGRRTGLKDWPARGSKMLIADPKVTGTAFQINGLGK
jgi:threonine dehydrogenase-like Zn-dependent dehydrogenase